MNVVEPWGKKKGQKKPRNAHFSRIDKYNKKRLASKPINPRPKPHSPQLEPLSPGPKPYSSQLEPLSPSAKPFDPRLEPTSPQPKVVSQRVKPVGPESQPSVFDTLGFITSYTESKTDNIFNNLTNAALPHHSPDFSFSKNAESFCGRNLLNEHDFLNETPAASVAAGAVSPFNIFSAIESKRLPTVLLSPQQIKAQFKSEVKRNENSQNQQENHNHQTINGNSDKNFS